VRHDAEDPDDTEPALEELYRETGPSLLAFLVRQVGDPEAAQDLLQETFAAAWRHPDRLRRAVSSRAYLFGIARNLAVTWFRRRHDTEPLTSSVVAEETAVDPRIERMREAIVRLKPEFREVLELRLQEELSYNEIAELLDLPVGTVRSRLHYAVRQLRQSVARPETPVLARKEQV
jgi:RNA polymerase sigma-70 factor (ECF subfamily)